jgi:DNA repair protein RadD
MELRPYQSAAIDSVFDYWDQGGGNALVDMATGLGKSLLAAGITKRLMQEYPATRALLLTHSRELIEQNAKALLRAWPSAPLGINSAGLGRRDKGSKVLYASIQSVAREDAYSLGERHVIIIDECHLIPHRGEGQYRTFLARMREKVPDLRLVGLSATPFRLDSGRLDEGEGSMFDDVVYSYGIGEGVRDGYLSPLVSRATGAVIDVSGVARRGGEFIAGELERAANNDAVTNAACDEIVAKGAERRAWLAFCCGIAHAESVADELRRRGIRAEAISSETHKNDRKRLIDGFKNGQIKCLTNANILTTGFDAPIVDMIAMLRPTLSTSLYVQMLGRGTRLAEGKDNCLVLDFARNIRRHGPVDAVEVERGGGGSGAGVTVETVRAKECPRCETLVGLRVYECPECGHEWERPAPELSATADTESAVMSRELVDRWLKVDEMTVHKHEKEGAPPSLKVSYFVSLKAYPDWVCLEHPGFAGARAQRWWQSVTKSRDVPHSIDEAMQRFAGEARIQAIQVKRDGKYWRVIKWRALWPDGRVVSIDEKGTARPVPVMAA